MTVVLLTGDLTVVSRVQGAAEQAGAALRTAGSAAAAAQLCVAQQATRLVIDLSMPSLDVAALVAELRGAISESPRIVAFGPHVHEERLAAARRAGCDIVVSRGEFFGRLVALLRG